MSDPDNDDTTEPVVREYTGEAVVGGHATEDEEN